MKITIKGQEIELCYTMRMMIIFENITGHSVDFNNMTSLNQATTLFLACIIASAKKAKLNFDITFDEFMDFLDENNGYAMINEFAIWLAGELEAKYGLLKKEDKEDELPKKTKKAEN